MKDNIGTPPLRERIQLTFRVTTLRPFRMVKQEFGWLDLAAGEMLSDAWQGIKSIGQFCWRLFLFILSILVFPLAMTLPLLFLPLSKRANWQYIRNHAEGRDIFDDGNIVVEADNIEFR